MSAPDPYEIGARLHRIMAECLRLATEQDMAATAALATRSMHQLAHAMRAGDARDIAEHPDLAELNVQLDGYYGDTTPEAQQ